MATPHTNLDVPNVKEWSFKARSLIAARIAMSYLTEFELRNDRFIFQRTDVQHTIKSNVEVAITTAAENEVDLARPVAPNVTYFEIIYFFVWSIMLVIAQAWRDFVERRPFRPTLATESAVHYYYLPMGRRDPRVVTSGPYNRLMIKLIPSKVTRRYEEDYDISLLKPVELVNCASNNYGGFSQLEYGAEKVIESALCKLPFAPAPVAMELKVRSECATYMGFDACITAPSGFSTNVLAFATAAGVARGQGRKMVFLCDRDCHNSMFTGAFLNKEARVHKFDHNDLTDLEYKLRMYRQQDPSALICVAVEGIYSMEGSVSPTPALLALKRAYKFTLLIDEAHSFMALGSEGRGSFNYWEDAGYECPMSEVDIMSCMFSKSVGCTGGFVLANGIFATELRKQGEARDVRGVETLSTIVLLRILGLLRKPLLIKHRMCMVREKAEYVARALKGAGCRVLSSPGSAVICFSVGTYSQVVRFHGEALKMGLAITGAGPPVTTMWACRVRLCIFATTTWPDIHRLLTGIVHIATKVKVRGVRPTGFDSSLSARCDPFDPAVRIECNSVDEALLDYVNEQSVAGPAALVNGPRSKMHHEVVLAGIKGLRTYGIGPCSARWFYGSFDVFIQLERRLAALYPSILAHSGQCRAMICGDAEITIGSTLTALVMRCASKKVVNRVFVPANATHSVIAGAKLRRPSKHVIVTFYDDVQDILAELDASSGSKFYLTIYLQTVTNGVILDLINLLRDAIPKLMSGRRLNGITIMLDDRNGLGKVGPQSLGYLNLMEANHGVDFLKNLLLPLRCSVQIIVAGSWFDAFNHQGGYVTGTASLIEFLTWDAKAFFFSTPPMPLQASMSNRMLRLLSEQAN